MNLWLLPPLRDAAKKNNEYMFSHYIDKQKDICICEIYKPFTEQPYSCVIENFSVEDFYFVIKKWS